MRPSRILVIEQEEFLRKRLVSVFSQAGFTTADVSDYREAQSVMVSFSPDVIIMDTALVDKDGFEACSELHSSLGIPIILVGREGGGKAWPRAVDSGADFYLTRPSACGEALVARVKAILRRYRKDGSSRRGKFRARRE
jgi:DNA-binding response OmpR family regulator